MKQERRDDAQLRKKIMLIIDHELSKQNPDIKMIEAYSAILQEMDLSAQQLDSSEREEEIKKLKQACHELMEKKALDSAKSVRGRRMVRKTVAVLCTITVVFGLLLGTVCAIGGVSPITILGNIGHAIFGWEVGEPVDIEGMTFIRNGEAKHYESVEQCLAQEDLNICEPTWLPEGVKIESIVMLSGAEYDRIIYELNTDDITISINLTDQTDDFQDLDYDSKVIDKNRKLYYAFDENRYRALLDTEGMVYILTADDIQTIENIVNGFKGDN